MWPSLSFGLLKGGNTISFKPPKGKKGVINVSKTHLNHIPKIKYCPPQKRKKSKKVPRSLSRCETVPLPLYVLYELFFKFPGILGEGGRETEPLAHKTLMEKKETPKKQKGAEGTLFYLFSLEKPSSEKMKGAVSKLQKGRKKKRRRETEQ